MAEHHVARLTGELDDAERHALTSTSPAMNDAMRSFDEEVVPVSAISQGCKE